MNHHQRDSPDRVYIIHYYYYYLNDSRNEMANDDANVSIAEREKKSIKSEIYCIGIFDFVY